MTLKIMVYIRPADLWPGATQGDVQAVAARLRAAGYEQVAACRDDAPRKQSAAEIITAAQAFLSAALDTAKEKAGRPAGTGGDEAQAQELQSAVRQLEARRVILDEAQRAFDAWAARVEELQRGK
jgi:hypothetical protein